MNKKYAFAVCLALFLAAPANAQEGAATARVEKAFLEAGELAGRRDYSGAKKILEKALVDARAAGAGRNAQMARLLHWLSENHHIDSPDRRSSALVALKQIEEAIAIRRELFGAKDLSLAGSLRHKGTLEGWPLGNFELSATSLTEAIDIYKLHGDAQRNEVFATLVTLAAAQSNRGDQAGKQQTNREALRVAQQLGETKDPLRLRTVAHLHRNIGELDEAVAFSLKALEVARTATPPDYRLVADLLWDIGETYAQFGLDAKVADYWKQSLKLREQLTSAEPMDVQWMLLAGVLVSNLYQYDEALSWYEKARLARIAVQGPTGLAVAEVLQAEGFVQLRLKNYTEAERKYLEALNIRNSQTQSSMALDRALLISHTSLAQLYQQQLNQSPKAALHYNTAEGLVQALARDVHELTAWNDSRIYFFEAGGQQDQALLQRFKFYAAQPDYSHAATNLGYSFSHWKESGKRSPRTFIARLFYKQGIQLEEVRRKQIKNPSSQILREYDERLKITYDGLADLLIASGRIVEAERVLMLLRNSSDTSQRREPSDALSFTVDEEELQQQMLRLATYYREEVGRLQRSLPQGESLRGEALKSVQKRYAEIDRYLMGQLLPIVDRWREDDYQLYASPLDTSKGMGLVVRPPNTSTLPRVDQIGVIPNPADIRKALDLLAQTRQTKSWGDPLSSNELTAAKFLLGAYDQRWQNIARYWANNQILPSLRNQMTDAEKHLVEKLRIRVVVENQPSAYANISESEIVVTTGLVRALYDFMSALHWIREYEDLAKHMFAWPMLALERTRDRATRADTSLFFEFLDYARATQRPVRAKYISVANDISEVHQAFAFIVGHEICHFVLRHRPFGEVKAEVARANEALADQCAKDRLKAAGYDTEYATVGFQVLMMNGFSPQGEFIFHKTHPHTLCRVAPYLDQLFALQSTTSTAVDQALAAVAGLKGAAELEDGMKELGRFVSSAGKESCENRVPKFEPSPRTMKLLEAFAKTLSAK
ncbi:tetratricopeptide repeat protein [Polaromonas sp. A23]|uniref:tetratricopeptide repeat protein n=1 Tax=Polaromonas sp. A23 TaxID=1944133 RepID=UPI000985AE28|nr:tetratricopeptide repeat protein [Polaromonas sp. A23]OOG35960.1 hypothetical protein B0B52_21900 [Polaromonas sp. A23]